jgi:divinyl protochlorophyllide a 8-vinyl-reductase
MRVADPFHADTPGIAHDVSRIGPNAISRIAEALRNRYGEEDTVRIFVEAGLDAYLPHMPTAMIDEDEVTRLHCALRTALGAEGARLVSRDAGRLTGDYLLAHRIPTAVRSVLRFLPSRWSARALLRAIDSNRWTFCGSAHLTITTTPDIRVTLAGCALCLGATAEETLCDYYAATFERLFRVLVDRRTVVTETECHASGASACVFTIAW